MIQPQAKESLKKYTTAAKHIIYDANRMREFAKMMDTRDGAVKAVQSIMALMEQTKPIPDNIEPLLGVNIYIIMVDMMQEIHQQAPDKQAVAQTMMAIIKAVAKQPVQQPVQPATQQPQPPQAAPMGLMGA